ncbi:MAG: alcohol dehydrogenase catalytic domain-containing protein [Victivallales bacterium]|nr:alcohol dehydrogenase catalytic domain-containing protein [Victivallales bacterium]
MSCIPETYTAWRLYGAGLENLRREELPMPVPGPKEILVHVDAVGLCFSDIKIIRAGASHPKLWWNDLETHPLTPGHEAVLTIVQAGSEVPREYAPGNRYLIQCDIYIHGRSCAFGYGMNGAYSEYQIIDERVWQGEERSYLLPLPDSLSAVGTALIEPWSCVQGAYRLHYRRKPLAGGKLLLATIPGNPRVYRAGNLFQENLPSVIHALHLSEEAVKALSEELGVPVQSITTLPTDVEYDDIACCDLTDRPLLEQVIARTAWRGIAGFYGKTPQEKCGIDVGALHYCHRYYQGAADGELSALYSSPCRNCLKRGGTAWFPGGAGAMGQMHVELALTEQGPDKILVSDLDDVRIQHLEQRLAPKAKRLEKTLKIVNPKQMSPEAFDGLLREFAPDGFDDIVILVPVVAIAAHAMGFLKDGALVNFFAGIPAGTPAPFAIGDFVERGIRLIGSSGSTFEDMQDTLQLSISSDFKPQTALAAIGGMNALKQGLEAVANGTFPGKTAILPSCPNLPLTPISELSTLDERLPQTLDHDGNYTKDTENLLLERWGKRL